MISNNPSVNRTGLHPGGVVPQVEHTELENELHDKAHIDYDRVAIVPNPSVAALYEDALVYETGSAITSTGALTAYSGAKTGRSPLDKRIVKEPSSENEIWWGPVNKAMTPDVSIQLLFFYMLRIRVQLPPSTFLSSSLPSPSCQNPPVMQSLRTDFLHMHWRLRPVKNAG
jgi:hypothetical protein